MIKVAIVDDHAVVRDGIKAILSRKAEDIKVVAEAANGKEAIAFAKENKADVYIIDISMPVLNGIETIERILKIDPSCKIMVLSMYDDRISVEKALKAGAKGFMVKVSNSDEIVQAVREIAAGRFFLCPKVSQYIVQGFLGKSAHNGQGNNGHHLTPKEREILQLIAEGHSSKDVAKELKLAVNTIHVHRSNIMRKLDIHKQADLVRYALKEGITHL